MASSGLSRHFSRADISMAAATTIMVRERRSVPFSYGVVVISQFRHTSYPEAHQEVTLNTSPQLSCWWRLHQLGSMQESSYLLVMVSLEPILKTRYF